jgi:hypothetical protein
MTLDPTVWGPHYWFVLHTIALSYPVKPNETMRKKYYDFYQNLPMFIPIEEMGNNLSKFLDKYPVTPYLESRQSLVRWTHFIHNKINVALGKETMTLEETMTAYYEHYKPKEVKNMEERRRREKLVLLGSIVLIAGIAGYLYTK